MPLKNFIIMGSVMAVAALLTVIAGLLGDPLIVLVPGGRYWIWPRWLEVPAWVYLAGEVVGAVGLCRLEFWGKWAWIGLAILLTLGCIFAPFFYAVPPVMQYIVWAATLGVCGYVGYLDYYIED